MDPYPHGIKHLKGKEWLKAAATCWLFVIALTFIWLLHVLFYGWYAYCFKPKGYLIRVGDILDDLETNGKWWNKHHDALARKVVKMNDPDEMALFTWRVHPYYMDNDILYVKSKGITARVHDEYEKIYRFN